MNAFSCEKMYGCVIMKEENMLDREEVRKIVRQLNIIDDALFHKMAEDPDFCEEVISTIMEQNIRVKKVIPQSSIKNLQGRSVVLDALCEAEDGRAIDVEVQKADDDDHMRRVRYNTSCITANITEPGTKFEKVPNVVGIFISKFDMFRGGKTTYHIDRTVRESGQIQKNGLEEIYVNAKIDDGSDIAELMKIFKESDVYDFERFPRVSKRKKQFKENGEEDEEMCDLIEEYAQKVAKRAAAEATKEAEAKAAKEAKAAALAREKGNALRLFQNGGSYDLVRASIPSISDEELQELYREATGGKP